VKGLLAFAVVLAGVAVLAAAYWTDDSYWQTLFLNFGCGLLLAGSLALLSGPLTARIADEVALQNADTTETAAAADAAGGGTGTGAGAAAASPADGAPHAVPSAPASPPVTYADFLHALETNGWRRTAGRGNHEIWRRGRDRIVTSSADSPTLRQRYAYLLARVLTHHRR
jgi:predicted RNA binding protein YcfA (HicA-like mRNA interferase family)